MGGRARPTHVGPTFTTHRQQAQLTHFMRMVAQQILCPPVFVSMIKLSVNVVLAELNRAY